jgi:hypothetical protein
MFAAVVRALLQWTHMNVRNRKLSRLLLAGSMFLANGCGDDGNDRLAAEPLPPNRCSPGMQTACSCPDGRIGQRSCSDDRSYLPCACGGGGAVDGGGAAPPADGGGPVGPPPRCDLQKPFGGPVALAINSAQADTFFRIADDELSAYFSSGRADSDVRTRIFRTARASAAASFGTPVEVSGLGASPGQGWRAPSITSDGLSLFVDSENPTGGPWITDLFAATRTSTSAAFGAATLVSSVNTDREDAHPFVTPDGLSLYFSSNRNGVNAMDVFVAKRASTGAAFGAAQSVAGVSSTENEYEPVLTPDELTIFFSRGLSTYDIYMATRSSKSAAFGTPSPVAAVNSSAFERPDSVSADGCVLYFSSTRNGQWDVFVAERPQ